MDHLLKIVKEFKNLQETGNLEDLYRNEWDKACLVHNVAYSDSKDLAKGSFSDKILKDRAYEVARKEGNRIRSNE